MPSDETLLLWRDLSRQYLRSVWELSGLDEASLSEEDQILAEIMRLHPEYYDLWERLDEVTDEELERDGTNPILHVMFHQIVENQIAANDPPETAETLARLVQQGKDRHEAVHEIAGVVVNDVYEIMKSNRPFDEQRYIRRLRHLVKPKKRRRRRKLF
ncbi:MAG: DUF1841 family protein [Anaerolineae bacterium]|nr:DUF1841 family protein [Anaerolineae bacterium]